MPPLHHHRAPKPDPLPPALRAILSGRPRDTDVYTASATGHQVGDYASAGGGKGKWGLLRGRAVGGQIAGREGGGILEGRRRRMKGDGDGDIRGWFGVGKRKRERERERERMGWEGGGKRRQMEMERVRDDGGALGFGLREKKVEREGAVITATTTTTTPTPTTTTIKPSSELEPEFEFDDPDISDSDLLLLDPDTSTNITTLPPPPPSNQIYPPIFTTLTIYISGSTAPLVTDHRLKHLLIRHGATIAFSLLRRRVTHVVMGRMSHATEGGGGGCGGGLAAGKLEREVRRVAGEGVRFVGVEWVLESIKTGKRLPEARFAPEGLRLGGAGQRSVLEHFS